MAQKTITITQTIFIPAKPEEVYNALIDEKKYTEFTSSKASIDPKVGERFTAWDGYIFRKNLKLEKEKNNPGMENNRMAKLSTIFGRIFFS